MHLPIVADHLQLPRGVPLLLAKVSGHRARGEGRNDRLEHLCVARGDALIVSPARVRWAVQVCRGTGVRRPVVEGGGYDGVVDAVPHCSAQRAPHVQRRVGEGFIIIGRDGAPWNDGGGAEQDEAAGWEVRCAIRELPLPRARWGDAADA